LTVGTRERARERLPVRAVMPVCAVMIAAHATPPASTLAATAPAAAAIRLLRFISPSLRQERLDRRSTSGNLDDRRDGCKLECLCRVQPRVDGGARGWRRSSPTTTSRGLLPGLRSARVRGRGVGSDVSSQRAAWLEAIGVGAGRAACYPDPVQSVSPAACPGRA
jgi:hypothetical protein